MKDANGREIKIGNKVVRAEPYVSQKSKHRVKDSAFPLVPVGTCVTELFNSSVLTTNGVFVGRTLEVIE